MRDHLAPDRGPSRARGVEGAIAPLACTITALLANWNLLRPEVVEGDALVHQYWMRRFADPALFTDSLTADLAESERYPDGYVALFRVASNAIDPIAFGEWLGVALMAVSGWLVFSIVRTQTGWRPAAWIAAGAFLALDVHRFFGGFPRGFVHVVVLLTVLLALRRRPVAAAVVAGAGALIYPPAALLASGVLAASAFSWHGGRPGVDARRAASGALALALLFATVAVPRLIDPSAGQVMTAAEARAYPEFGPRGGLHFFASSPLDYLRQNRSGFDLRASGSLLLLAALGLVAARPRAARRIPREVLALPVIALAAYAAAQLVLFKLYLPHRYTYPLVAFFAIVVGLLLLPVWQALCERPRPRPRSFALLVAPVALLGVAVHLFPLGPLESPAEFATPGRIAAVVATVALAGAATALLGTLPAARRPAVGAVLTGMLLIGALLTAHGHRARGQVCAAGPAMERLASLPKDAVIAGDPIDLRCVPFTARRAVVSSTQLAPSYETGYFLRSRARMFALLRAYYGPSPAALAVLHRRYGATHVWVRRGAVERERTGKAARWKAARFPYGRFVRRLVTTGEPATLRLPATCRTWAHGREEIYDIPCVARRTAGRRM